MAQPSLIRRASKRCLRGLKRTLSREKTTEDDRSSISQRPESRSSFSSSSLFTTRTLEEDEYKALDEPIPEDAEEECPSHHQGQSYFFRKLPPEIREQIYREFWRAAGVERHAFLHERKLRYSPCITDHEAPDERQIGVARDFAPSPDVQIHQEWFERMGSKWCNHWRCEGLWKDIQAGRAVDLNKTQAYMSLLLSCKQIYNESIDSFRECKIVNITDGPTLQRILKYPRPRHLTRARRINISLRADTGNYLYLSGASVWHVLSEPAFRDLRRVYLWLDAECPVTRRLLPEFRELWTGVPASIAPRLTVDFPCDAADGFWAWGEVEAEVSAGAGASSGRDWCAGGDGRAGGRTKTLEAFVPRFTVVARGRQRFNETSAGYVSREDKGRPKPRVLGASNPFEDILLYGRGIHDDNYY